MVAVRKGTVVGGEPTGDDQVGIAATPADAQDPRAPIADGPTVQDDLPEDEFLALMGAWHVLPPDAVARLLSDAPFDWWITGGWALELFTGHSRPHDDVDVAFLLRDLPSLRQWAGHQGFHLWAPGPARLRPVLAGIRVEDDEQQFWLRRDASSPWLLDLLATPTDGDDWVFKKDERITRPLDGAVTHVDGIPIISPEIGLLFKAALDRPKDRADLRAVLPRLAPDQRTWLADSLRTWQGQHPWLELL